MAVTVTIEFTDAQWALVEANYNKPFTSDDKVAELGSYLKEDVEAIVVKQLRRIAADAKNDAFNV